MDDEQHIISKNIQTWYRLNKRDLPWRQTNDPYKIWVSEVILQQTRVAQGLEYYYRFIQRFPNVQELAHADENEVLKLWQGLGYYSRARNMHFAAKQVVDNYQASFPNHFEKLLELKGIGEYTAAAVSSISSNQPVAVVDGNVERVLSRLFGMELPVNGSEGKKQTKQLAASILDINNAGNHNQAMMELGALVCVPRNANCNACPVQQQCWAFRHGNQNELPVKLKKVKQRKRYFNYFLLQTDAGVFMRKRSYGDIWNGLYELFLVESENDISANKTMELFHKATGLGAEKYQIKGTEIEFKHVLSHQVIHAKFYRIQLQNGHNFKVPEYDEFPLKKMAALPIARLTDRYFKHIHLFTSN